ncbi:MAG: DUF1566 domain-containing protein [Gammaproteobacteria bacterium]|nr:DUF1566 domain-containing protein [Gammaproteobacteria bacterium]
MTHTSAKLMWDRCAWRGPEDQLADCGGSPGEYSWAEAFRQVQIANAKNHKNYTDWRLPSKTELVSLVEYKCYEPAIDISAFPAAPSLSFWSSSQYAGYPDGAWHVYFLNGYVGYDNKSNAKSVRFVRDIEEASLPDNESPRFTKLDAAGDSLLDTDTEWNCVQDNISNLIWEVKTDDDGLHDKDWTYTWFDPRFTKFRSDPDLKNGGICEGGDICDTSNFVLEVKRQSLCGVKNWRMPTPGELSSIVDISRLYPAIYKDYFPNTPSSGFWSSSSYAHDRNYAWYVHFIGGYVYGNYKNALQRVRLVGTSSHTALSFDGRDDYVKLPAAVWFKDDFTIEGWVYPRSYDNGPCMLDIGNDLNSDNIVFCLSENTTGKPFLDIHKSGVSKTQLISPTVVLPLNAWSHIAVTLSGQTGLMYINGVQKAGNTSMNIPDSVVRHNAYIGWGSNDSYANAIFDEVRIWGVARTQAEIQANMNSALTGSENGLTACYNFDEGGGVTITDISGSSDESAWNIGPTWVISGVPMDSDAGP